MSKKFKLLVKIRFFSSFKIKGFAAFLLPVCCYLCDYMN